MNLQEITERMKVLKEWNLDGSSISKDFEFEDFKDSIEFVNKVAEVAESEKHHPDISVSYNKVRLRLTTHDVKGLTLMDFKVAEGVDKIG